MKILIAEDDSVTRNILQRILLKQGHNLIVAEDGERAWKLFLQYRESVYMAILDWEIPKIDGIELCKRIRSTEIDHYVYLLILSSKTKKQEIVTGLEAGADDYLTKPFHPEELVARIKVGKRIINLEQSLRKANERLEFLATIDGLTGVLNQRTLLERLKEELVRGARNGHAILLIMLDIDNFKYINDTFGHLSGNRIIVDFINSIKSQLRPYDILGRYGGDEFLIIIPCQDGNIHLDVPERLCSAIKKNKFAIGDQELKITASFGAISILPYIKKDPDKLFYRALKRVDEALYQAKAKGRNCVVYIPDVE